MRKYKFVLTAALSITFLSSFARVKMADVFANMPDSIIPYLTKNNRLDCIDFKASKMAAIVKNKFDDNSELITINDNYLDMKLSECAQLEMKLLPYISKEGDSTQIICKIITCSAPEAESNIVFYTTDWKRLNIDEYVSIPSFDNFWIKPDTMTLVKYNTLRSYIDPIMIRASLSEKDYSMTFSLAKPLLSKDDKKQLEGICIPQKMIWNNKIFK
jgi:hypothetical protein